MLNAILVSVDYWDYLSVTLPYNRHHFNVVCVVTAPHDERSAEIARKHDCMVHVTDAFYRHGAMFNKWLALEEGLDALGRYGWLCIMDADVLWPSQATLPRLDIGCLYGPLRRMALEPDFEESRWQKYGLHHNTVEWPGYTQIFHADDPHLPTPPWHDTCWIHAGGADSDFQALWPEHNKRRLAFDVLHIGTPRVNWCGRATRFLDGSVPDKANERLDAVNKLFMERKMYGYKNERITTLMG